MIHPRCRVIDELMGPRNILSWAATILGLAVVLGAFGAHGLKDRLSLEHLGQWKTGVEYQFYHGLGLLLLAALGNRVPAGALKRISWFFFLGVLLFSGSLYLLSTRELTGLGGATAFIGPVTPLGGLFFIAGWAQLLITALARTDRR